MGFQSLCGVQDFLSGARRRTKYRHRTSAAQWLPHELQLHIFALLRTRAAFGMTERLMAERELEPPGAFNGGSDLAAVRLVCRAWRDAATEALYADVTLVTARACIAFSRVLLAHPTRAQLVRRIVFPRASRNLTNDNPQPSSWVARLIGIDVRRMDLKAAIDHIVVQCTRATDVTFFRTARTLDGLPGLMQCAQRLTHLAVRHLDGENPFCAPFPLAALERFPQLQSLTLQHHHLVIPPSMTPAPTVHTLRLGRCLLKFEALHMLLAHLPNLRVLALRDTAVLDQVPLVRLALLFAPAHTILTECALIDVQRVSVPKSLTFFSALRRLTICAWMFAKVKTVPPLLQELIITTAPSPTAGRATATRRRKALLDIARRLVRLLTRNVDAPSLRSVQLWDTVLLSQLPDCSVVAYVLREMLRPAGIDVAVNVFLVYGQEKELHARFRRERRNRRLLWRDVI
ncbi:hypothetical protein AURDEDRAFT_170560 [Auricularia subglabra TFB-10046 SS5]|nr:hypothetical protein AURDEDRAFT_170560 [Auricularia subglabra TFB-10046 SS5]